MVPPFLFLEFNPVGVTTGHHRPGLPALPCCVTLEFINFSVAYHQSLTWVNTVGHTVLSLLLIRGWRRRLVPEL